MTQERRSSWPELTENDKKALEQRRPFYDALYRQIMPAQLHAWNEFWRVTDEESDLASTDQLSEQRDGPSVARAAVEAFENEHQGPAELENESQVQVGSLQSERRTPVSVLRLQKRTVSRAGIWRSAVSLAAGVILTFAIINHTEVRVEVSAHRAEAIQADKEFAAPMVAATGGIGALTYRLLNSPAGMTIDERTGVIQWTPSSAQARREPYEITVQVSDLIHAPVTQTRYVTVVLIYFVGWDPPIVAKVGVPYAYTVRTANTEDFPASYELTVAPEGMSIGSATGEITWIPASDQAGQQYTVTVGARVQTAGSMYIARSFSVSVD